MKVTKYVIALMWFAAIDCQSFQWGLAARQGDRRTMEDEHSHIVLPHEAFFAVYDGHGGTEAAEYASKELSQHFFDNMKKKALAIEEDLVRSFEQTDAEILKKTDSGSCAVVTYLTEDGSAYIAWVGDSRAVVVRDGRVLFATTDHKPDSKEEKSRLLAFGLNVYHAGVPRIFGLAVSRTLGDKYVKEESQGAVTATPEVQKIAIQPGDLIILACDGVWDVLSNEQAATLAWDIAKGKESLAELAKKYPLIPKNRRGSKEVLIHQNTNALLQAAADALRDEAYDKGSGDNISAMVILYSPKPAEELKEREEVKEGKEQSVRSGSMPNPATKNFILFDRLQELQSVAAKNKLTHIANAAQNVFTLIKNQPNTADVLALAQEFLNEIDANTKIQYFGQPTTLKTLLDPIKNNIAKDVKALRPIDSKKNGTK